MKVNDVKDVSPVREAAPVAKVSSPVGAPVRDRVSTTRSLEANSALQSAQRSAGTQRLARLQQLDQAVKSGQYKPSPTQIADSIVEDATLTSRLQEMLRQ